MSKKYYIKFTTGKELTGTAKEIVTNCATNQGY